MNKLFSTALVRLTVLYVTALALVCILFSGFIYRMASDEIDRSSRRQAVGFRNMISNFFVDEVESERLRLKEAENAKYHLKVNLFLINTIVIGGGAYLCYLVAKKTLEPIEEGVRAQERFTSDASHELRTPLASMKTEIEVALRDPKLSLQEAKELLQSNLEEVDTLHVMTENLLHLARNKELGEFKQIDSLKLLRAVAKKYQAHAKKEGMTIGVRGESVKVTTNQQALRQIISILLDNAVKYAGKGASIELACVSSGDSLTITVTDNGPGLDDEQLKKVFERFYKADSSRTNSRASGHGLGLSIAKHLSRALNGDITAEKGHKGKGLQFHISLPLV